ncbi:hypothetical protein M378DRAFT_27014 [Amanita muscaria Koide BX008]|uniref:Uncharacterized protein n=1 Tax=Amanita muscaria (strain Koide BX008) TaxID=946122 RepID=A0A0C2WSS3_AMAMK|nr:hypothetical protein M378DRAFT_27014 [Amanita muscaria Koide BX008]
MTTNESRAANLELARRWSQKIDITLDVSVGVLTTLKYVAKISPVAFLSNAASIALSIVDVVQKMRSNKHGFKELANDSCEIVCDIINAYKDISQSGDVPIDLLNHLGQLVNVLRSINEFARKGASRNFLAALLRFNADARRVQDYQRKLYQALQIFGLQSDIIVRNTIAQLAANQVAMTNQLNTRVLALPPCMFLSPPILPPDILWWPPQEGTSRLVNIRTLSHLENMDNCVVISTPIMDRQDIIEFINHVRCTKLRLKDCDRREQCLFNTRLFAIIHDTPLRLFPDVMGLLRIVASRFFVSMRIQSEKLSDGARTAAKLLHRRCANHGLLAL